ncbi:MAG: tol-pal system protein YbgF [bacterium]
MKKFTLIIFAALFGVGCATSSSVRDVKRDTAYMRAQIETMREDQRRIVQALVKLQSLVQQSSEASGQLRAELKVQLDRLARESQILSARMEDTDQRISKLPRKIQIVTPTSRPDSSAGEAGSDSLLTNLKSNISNARVLYESAYQDLVKGQYKLAESGFRQYLQLIPEGELSDNAQYWIGECFYAQKRFDEAAREFSNVVRQFPNGDKVPAAMLKLGYSQYATGQRERAVTTLQDLVREHPFSNEAKLAQSRIKEMRK